MYSILRKRVIICLCLLHGLQVQLRNRSHKICFWLSLFSNKASTGHSATDNVQASVKLPSLKFGGFDATITQMVHMHQ